MKRPDRLLAAWLASYRWTGFRHDLVAGLTVSAVALPQGMAYALIAGVDPVYGLYTAIVVTALGSLFGSSAHLINGPTNALSLATFSAVAGLGLLDETQKLQAIFLLSLFVGAIQILIALFRLGDLTRYVSESVILGFTVGAAILIALGQIPNLLGLQGHGGGHPHLLMRLWETLKQLGSHPPAAMATNLAIGLGTVLAALGLRYLRERLRIPLPHTLLALLLASLAAWLFGLYAPPGEPAPGFPTFHVPRVDYDWVPHLAGSAFSVAMLGLLEALAIAKAIASRTRQPLDYNRQCLAEGLANLGGGFFQCLPGSGSLTRSAINYQAGAVSQVSGLVAAGVVALCLLLLAPLAAYVPRAALAGTLLVTAWWLVDRPRLGYCLRATRFDRGLALTTAAACVFINIEFSILIGVFLSFLFFVPRAAHLRAAELAVTPERLVRERQPDDPPCGKLVILDLEGDLFFGAASRLQEYLDALTRRADQGARAIVLRVKRTRNADMACLEILEHFLKEMEGRDVRVLLCGVRPDLKRGLKRLDFFAWLPPDRVFEEAGGWSSTLAAVRTAYAFLGDDLCPPCPRRGESTGEVWYYMI